MKLLKTITLALVALTAAVAVWIAADMNRFSHQPAGDDAAPHVIEVAPGETFTTLSAKLKHQGIVTSDTRFKWLARAKGQDRQLKAGEYVLTATMTPNDVLDVLVTGKVKLRRLTIPEGYSVDQIAIEVEHQGFGDAAEVRRLAKDPALLDMVNIQGPSLEGYLFPDTYFFPKGASVRTILETMLRKFNDTFTDQWRQRAEELNFSRHQIVTLASIIEKETGAPSERPIISSVFHNRLKKRMRLESDPTVIYGIENFDGNITRRHLSTKTPYNTYVIRGLPPGPIANPGRAALEAALYPDQTNYLFFVAKKNGTHFFSSTIEEHNQAVRKYQLRRKGR